MKTLKIPVNISFKWVMNEKFFKNTFYNKYLIKFKVQT